MKSLIAIPTKTKPYYAERFKACQETWLKGLFVADNCGNMGSWQPQNGEPWVAYKVFSDSDLGLDENDPRVPQYRTKLMAKYAHDNGYEFMLRIDADAYCYVNRLPASGFEKYDYVRNGLDYTKHLEVDRGRRTAHGGAGFILSRKAMEIVANWEPFPQSAGIYWDDIGTGELLWKHGIHYHKDSRFLDKGDGHFNADKLPKDHGYVTLHPVEPEQLRQLTPLPPRT